VEHSNKPVTPYALDLHVPQGTGSNESEALMFTCSAGMPQTPTQQFTLSFAGFLHGPPQRQTPLQIRSAASPASTVSAHALSIASRAARS
jgi:hypothetical protein